MTSNSPHKATRSLINEALRDSFTGVIAVTFADGIRASLLSVDGRVPLVYRGNWRLPSPNWEDELKRSGEGSVFLRRLPANGICFEKILLEQSSASPPQRVKTDQLKAMFDHARQIPAASLFHIRWHSAEAFVMSAGGNIPIQKAVVLTGASAEEGLVALNQINEWREADCTVTIYRGEIRYQAWLEAHLNLLFEWSCGYILQQYAKLTGFVMVTSIARNLRATASQNQWLMNVNRTEVGDATIFPSAAEAGDAYRNILASVHSQVEPVIGSALTRSLMDKTRGQLRDLYKTIEEVFHLLGEETP